MLSNGEFQEFSWKDGSIIDLGSSPRLGSETLVGHVSGTLVGSERGHLRKLRIMRETILQFANESFTQRIRQKCERHLIKLSQECLAKKIDHFSASQKLIKAM